MPCTAYWIFKYLHLTKRRMTKSIRPVKKEVEYLPVSLERVFEGFRREMESMMKPWPELWGLSQMEGARAPLCDMKERADRYELQVEIPGIEKDKIEIKASSGAVEISGEQSEKVEEKRKAYVYNERSRKLFYRKIRMPEEIDPSKVSANMNNGVLVVDLPKKAPAKSRKEETTKVEVK